MLQTFVSEIRKQAGGRVGDGAFRVGVGEGGGTSVGGVAVVGLCVGGGVVASDGEASMEMATPQSVLFTNSGDVDELRTGYGKPIAVSQKSTIAFKVDAQTETNLRIFKQRLEKQTGEVQDWNFVMKKLLQIAGEHKECGIAAVATAKKQAAPTVGEPSARRAQQLVPAPGDLAPTRAQQLATLREKIKISLPQVSKRHIPAMVKKYLQLKYDGKCGFPNCKNPADIMHHVRRFILVPNHDPDKIVPLCKKHERLAHQGLIENEDGPPETWRIRMQPDKNSPKYQVDLKVNSFRMPGRNG